MSFSSLGLAPELLRAIERQGYKQPTPIQRKAIPLVLQGHDLMASAQTGTGKTAAFTLPMLQKLAGGESAVHGRPRALVLTPTRELAQQVADSARTYGRNLSLRTAVLFGGVGLERQLEQLSRGVDIIVATPGRLIDHIRRRSVDLSEVELLVLDEADRMLDMGFIHDIGFIIDCLPEQRQGLLFSATFSPTIRKLAGEYLHKPRSIEVERRNSTGGAIKQRIFVVDKERKRALLSRLIRDGNWQQVLVFTRTRHGAERLTGQLQDDGIRASAIHGDKAQGQRMRALAEFKEGKVQVLVATDVAARGLDIEALPHVVNFDLPGQPEDYVHRIGRTGRGGRSGEAISLYCAEEKPQLLAIQELIGTTLPTTTLEGFEPTPAKARKKPAKAAVKGTKKNAGKGGKKGTKKPGGKGAKKGAARAGGKGAAPRSGKRPAPRLGGGRGGRG